MAGGPRSLTFLHAAWLRGRGWDGPQEGLQDGHRGLGTVAGKLSQAGGEGMGHVAGAPTPSSRGLLPPACPVSSSCLGSLLSPPPRTPSRIQPSLQGRLPSSAVPRGRAGSPLSPHRGDCTLWWGATPAPAGPRSHGRRPQVRVTLATPATPREEDLHSCAGPPRPLLPWATCLQPSSPPPGCGVLPQSVWPPGGPTLFLQPR